MPEGEYTQVDTSTRAPGWLEPFLESLRQNCNVTLACRACKISRFTPYAYREDHPEFRKQWDDAVDEGADVLEAEAWRRAKEGTVRPVFQGGKKVGHVREYSDTLMQTLLKGHKPEKYRERTQMDHSGSVTVLDGLRERKEESDKREQTLNDNPELSGEC